MGISRAEYARRCGKSRAAVSKWVLSGKIKLLPDGTIDPAEADAMRRANTIRHRATPQTAASRPKASKSDEPSHEHKFNKARARKESAKAISAEVQARKDALTTVEIDDVKRAWLAAGKDIQARLLAIPDRITQKLAGEENPHVIRALLVDEFTEVLKVMEADVRGL